MIIARPSSVAITTSSIRGLCIWLTSRIWYGYSWIMKIINMKLSIFDFAFSLRRSKSLTFRSLPFESSDAGLSAFRYSLREWNFRPKKNSNHSANRSARCSNVRRSLGNELLAVKKQMQPSNYVACSLLISFDFIWLNFVRDLPSAGPIREREDRKDWKKKIPFPSRF